MEHTCHMLTPGDGLPCKYYLRPDDPTEPGFCSQPTRFFCSEAMKHKLPAISYSRLTDFIRCRQLYYHAVIQGLNVKPHQLPEPLKLGQAWSAFTRFIYEDTPFYEALELLQLSPEQTAKISALARAYRDLKIYINRDRLISCEFGIYVPVGQNQIIGSIDRAYEGHIVESKLSTRPDFYTQRENVAYQLGTYFLGNEEWESATMEVVRTPSLRTGQGKYSEEDPGEYEERLYGDIISRPGHYFLGWDRETRTYGVKFWRSEFDLDEIYSTYVHVLREIHDTLEHGAWYPNNLACHVPAACPYLPIKRSGVVSEEVYERRETAKFK
jgi:hypothetical protein